MPILDNEGEVVGVAQIVNKMSAEQKSFSAADEEVAHSLNILPDNSKYLCRHFQRLMHSFHFRYSLFYFNTLKLNEIRHSL